MQILTRNAGVLSALTLCTLLSSLVGCVVLEPHSVEILKETRKMIYKGHQGPKLPEDKAAWVDWGFVSDLVLFKVASGYVVSIDNLQINPTHRQLLDKLVERKSVDLYDAAELLPGVHTFDFECTAARGSTHSFRLQTNIEAGHIYRIHCDAYKYAKSPLLFATEMIDVKTGELVAGRPVEALDWSWSDFELVLQELKNDKTSKQRIIEMFQSPSWPSMNGQYYDFGQAATGVLDANKTIIYSVYPAMTGVLMDNSGEMIGYIRRPLPFFRRQRGLLFMEFDESNRLSSFQYVDIPDHECLAPKPSVNWYTPTELVEDGVCQSLAFTLTIAEYLADIDNQLDSYLAVERGLLANTNLADGRLGVNAEQYLPGKPSGKAILLENIRDAKENAQSYMFTKAKQFFDQHPLSLEAAKELFTEEGLRKLQQVTEKDFDALLRRKLLIYGEFASRQAFADAQNCSRRFLDNKRP